jgi:RNA polymerase sigma-70 factor, ECF subfamily
MHESALEKIVAKAGTGDPSSIAALYDHFAARVYRYVLVRVHAPSDAEDLLQRIFLKVIEGLPSYESRGCHLLPGSSGSHGTR